MIKGLEDVVFEFYEKKCLKNNLRKDYNKIYRSFVDYLNSTHLEDVDAETFIKHNLHRDDIIGSCVQYFMQDDITSITSITKHLNALTHLYKNCFLPLHWDNATLEKSLPFSKLSKEVVMRSDKKPSEITPIPPLTREEFENVRKYLSSYVCNTPLKHQFYIVCNLFLYLGFKLERIASFRREDYIPERGILVVHCKNDMDIPVELPNSLNNHLSQYCRTVSYQKSDLLFQGATGKPLSSQFFYTASKPFRQRYSGRSYSLTGFAKYGVVQLLDNGLEPYFVQLITGMDDIIMKDCIRHFIQQKYPTAAEVEKQYSECIQKLRATWPL